jgi:hypothetical protein
MTSASVDIKEDASASGNRRLRPRWTTIAAVAIIGTGTTDRTPIAIDVSKQEMSTSPEVDGAIPR